MDTLKLPVSYVEKDYEEISVEAEGEGRDEF